MTRADIRLELICFLGAIAAVVVAVRALTAGKITLGTVTFTRSESDFLYWTSIGACVALGIGLVLLVTANGATSRNWLYLVGSAFLLVSALYGLKTGTTTLLRGQKVTRYEDGYLYWFAIGLQGVFGIGGILIVAYKWWLRIFPG